MSKFCMKARPKQQNSPNLTWKSKEGTSAGPAGDAYVLPEVRIHAGDSEEVRFLKVNMIHLTSQYQQLCLNYERKQMDLLSAVRKANELEKKLQFVKDNQILVQKLKSVYMKMRNTSTSDTKLATVTRDDSCQTWDGIVCSYCLETRILYDQMDKNIDCEHSIIVHKNDIDEIKETVEFLKQLILHKQSTSLIT